VLNVDQPPDIARSWCASADPDGEEWWPATANRRVDTHVLLHWVDQAHDHRYQLAWLRAEDVRRFLKTWELCPCGRIGGSGGAGRVTVDVLSGRWWSHNDPSAAGVRRPAASWRRIRSRCLLDELQANGVDASAERLPWIALLVFPFGFDAGSPGPEGDTSRPEGARGRTHLPGGRTPPAGSPAPPLGHRPLLRPPPSRSTAGCTCAPSPALCPGCRPSRPYCRHAAPTESPGVGDPPVHDRFVPAGRRRGWWRAAAGRYGR
jgi:hypothetical protein